MGIWHEDRNIKEMRKSSAGESTDFKNKIKLAGIVAYMHYILLIYIEVENIYTFHRKTQRPLSETYLRVT